MNNLLRLRPSKVPSNGWKVQWHGEKVTAGDKGQLIDLCANVNRRLGIPVPIDLAWLVEDALCRALPPSSKDCSPRTKLRTDISAGMVKRFMVTLALFFLNGGKYVEQEEATRRASICADCPAKTAVSGCWGCKGIGKLVAVLKGKRSTPYDDRTLHCGVCGCHNPTQNWMPLDVLQKVSGDLDYAAANPACWKQ